MVERRQRRRQLHNREPPPADALRPHATRKALAVLALSKVGAAVDWASPRLERGLLAAGPKVEAAAEKVVPAVDAACHEETNATAAACGVV